MNQNIDSFGSDQIQTPHYPIIHPPSQEISEEVFQAKGYLMKSFYDDEEYSNQYKEYLEKSPDAIAPILPTKEPEYSLIEDSDSLMDGIDIFLATDELLPPSIESSYDSKEDIYVLEELLVDNSIPSFENKLSDFYQDDPSFPCPPLEPPDVEFDFEPNSGEVISAVINNIDELNEDNFFDPGGEIDIFANVKDDDYFPFIFVI
nr:hypothetical protein [Tanacetum cinerariifolium]